MNWRFVRSRTFVRESPVARGTNTATRIFPIDMGAAVPNEWLINFPQSHRVEVLAG
jgi:hypothetical protein